VSVLLIRELDDSFGEAQNGYGGGTLLAHSGKSICKIR
jgi:hypothetical protein